MCRKNKRVAPAPLGDEFERDPPITCADSCIFMPVLVTQGLKHTLLDEQNVIRPFTVNERLKKINPTEFVASMMLSPENFNLPFESIYFQAKDGVTLNAFLIRLDEDRDKVPTIMLFHGNSGNIGDNLTWAVAMFGEILCNIFMLDYRGYGYSEGVPSERGAYWDAQAAFDYVYARHDLNNKLIVLHGQSIGGAIALDLAVRKDYKSKVAGLVIENTFSSLKLLLHHYSQRRCLRPIRLLFKCFHIKGKVPSRTELDILEYLECLEVVQSTLSINGTLWAQNLFRNSDKVAKILCPTLVIASMKDNIIPPSHSSLLFDSSNSCRKRFYVDAQAEHMNAYMADSYYQEIARFLVEVVLNQEASNNRELSNEYLATVRKSRSDMGPNVKRMAD